MASFPALGTGRRAPRPAAIARWLFAVAALILVMVAIGGITRLTESGLSITQWKPVTGAIPPISDADWQAEFDRYRRSSQYLLMNRGMTLAAFQHIYFWEYLHRLIGRLVGIAYALPLLWFLIRGAVPRGHAGRLVALLALGGAQGAVGWLMVRSGLADRVNVEPAMLAAHLGLALLLLAAITWEACDMRALAGNTRIARARPTALGAAVLAALFAQVLAGAITAGLHAGQVASTWPLMNDHLVPEGIRWWGSLARTLTSDAYLIHFLHRWWAWVAAVLVALLARRVALTGGRGLAAALLGAVALQLMLGIATVLTGVALPLATAHQLVGAILVGLAAAGTHRLACRRA